MLGLTNTSIPEAWRGHLLFALLTDAENINDRLFKRQAIEKLLRAPELRDQGLSRDDILLRVEEFGGLRPRNRLWELLASIPLLEEREGRYCLRATLPLTAFPAAGRRLPKSLGAVAWTLAEIDGLFFPVVDTLWTVRNLGEAIYKGYGWLLWTADHARDPANQLEAMPAFWQCQGGEDAPLGFVRAITGIGDALGALADSHYFPHSIERAKNAPGPALDSLLRWLLACRAEPDAPPGWDEAARNWHRGGFWPFDDQPEAVYPTVDATWDAVLALGSVHDQYDRLATSYGPFHCPRSAVGEALLDGIEFLLRTQLPAGGWGIYRYPGDQPPVPAHEFTTGQTLLALRLVLLSEVFEERERPELRAAVEAALRRAWAFLRERAVNFQGRQVWLPFFGDRVEDYASRDILRASVWTGAGLLALYRGLPDLRGAIAPRLADLLDLANIHWEPDYRRIAEFEFRVPLDERLHDNFGKWSNRYDVTLAIFLLDLFNEGRSGDGGLPVEFGPGLWRRLERTIGEILREQHPEHGHWNEPVAGMPLAAATAMAMQVLQHYLIAARHLIG
ncbi:MAG: hypothetical protein P9F19_15270 [Candidatus Contendobacter sp.]|nr:hypothetical protein [Candidatus Contendobacter sp.]MDG4558734.1 hypothetical protein [Candidatus Contendobacter sp.]